MTLHPPSFEPMFQRGARYRFHDDVGGGEAVIEVQDAGILHLPTGRLVACDPSLIERGMAAFSVAVPPGRYPVEVSIARVDRPEPGIPAPVRSGAAARLIVRDEPAVKWELALQPGEDLATLAPGSFYGFRVEGGIGAFMDASAVAALNHLGTQSGLKTKLDEIGPEPRQTQMANVVLDPAAELNVVIFDCGMGDGAYPVWIGRTVASEVGCFVADLELLSRHSDGPISV